MRFVNAYYFFLLYLTVVFQPLIPVISDAFAHTFEHAVHISTVHASYGNNHLEISVAETNADNNNHENHTVLNTEEPFPVHLAENTYHTGFPAAFVKLKYAVANLYLPPFAFIAKQFPPPKFS